MTVGTTCFGHPFSQDWQDLFIWEMFFQTRPIKSLIELGTGNGGMSVFFAIQAFNRDIKFATFDNQKFFDFSHGVAGLLGLNQMFFHYDIFEDPGLTVLRDMILKTPHPLALFCDNGDKAREWRTFGPLLIPGDYIVVHDWGTEFKEEHMVGIKVQRIMEHQSDMRIPGWKSMWFQVT